MIVFNRKINKKIYKSTLFYIKMIKVKVSKKLKRKSIYAREDIEDFISSLPAEEKSVLDFRGFNFLGPSAAHELLRNMKEKNISLINLNKELRFMLETQNKVRKVGLDLNNNLSHAKRGGVLKLFHKPYENQQYLNS